MRLGRWMSIVVVASLATACGASAKQVKAAKKAVYKCDYPVVWKAVREEFVERYSKVDQEAAEAGIIISLWEWYDAAGARKRGGDTVSVGPDDAIFRIAVQIIQDEKAGGWRVAIEGAAQGHVPGSPKPVPFKRGSADEPAWVQSKIDVLAVAIHERLAQYDIAAGGSK